MYKNKKCRFENFWLQSTEANLKFAACRQTFLLNNNGVYLQHNAWIQRREVIDRVLKRQSEYRALIAISPLKRLVRMACQLYDSYIKLLKNPRCEYDKTQRFNIYDDPQNSSVDIMSSLTRINARVKARREEAGIPASDCKIEQADEAVKIALRAALKLRK